MRRNQAITLEQKLRYLREIENIHRLSKKTLPPQGTTWTRIADGVLRKAMGHPVQAPAEEINMVRSGHMEHHSPRTARLIERTLRNGVVHPDVLHDFRNDGTQIDRFRGRPYSGEVARPPRPALDPVEHTPQVEHYVQHPGDLHYPGGHLQGYGFVPRVHQVASHVQLESPVPSDPYVQVPTTQGSVGHSAVSH